MGAVREFALPGIRAADAGAMARLGRRYFLPTMPEETSGPFTAPTLVLTGRQDHVVGYEDQYQLVKTYYPTATYVAVHGAGHNVHLDRFAISSALVGEWAQSLAR